MVTRGSWATPHTMEACVPLMTLWSWGGLVMRVRAERQQGVGEVSRGVGSGLTGGEGSGGEEVSAGEPAVRLPLWAEGGRPAGERVGHSERPGT